MQKTFILCEEDEQEILTCAMSRFKEDLLNVFLSPYLVSTQIGFHIIRCFQVVVQSNEVLLSYVIITTLMSDRDLCEVQVQEHGLFAAF